MILHNGDVLFGWPLQSHVITAGWFYNDGSLHRALDFRAAVGTPVSKPPLRQPVKGFPPL